MNNIYKKDNVSLCFKDACINAVGKNGTLITIGAFILLGSIALINLSKIK